jgi:hypothetical protein
MIGGQAGRGGGFHVGSDELIHAHIHTQMAAFEPLSPFDAAAAATDDAHAHGAARMPQINGGGGGVLVPPPAPAPPMAAAAAMTGGEEEEEHAGPGAFVYHPFFSRMPGDFRESAAVDPRGEREEGGVDLCGPVIRRSML